MLGNILYGFIITNKNRISRANYYLIYVFIQGILEELLFNPISLWGKRLRYAFAVNVGRDFPRFIVAGFITKNTVVRAGKSTSC